MERKEFIKNEIKEEPNNPFNYYLLALELKKEGDLRGAIDLFTTLIKQFPIYIPTYYSFADYLLEIEEDDKAKQIIELGIEQATIAGQKKALHELKQMWELNF
ncbi:tetratricopeptide repeat protein [Aquirufa ecclesiirivi]|uniref:Tetratricopeptide repeat protein n=1 Tax=Aquirufa ecclesiirivi TaxID=2715124 RepID=A0ABT4JD49_9BACT|nr:tetratricopeptide repeat protein [Aquirufa ecclesiirivi]MCZ2472110.1 tetratricopeptide repeat protein [Aquirufa ecclesiirivi]MCZ2474212.1 tetratricopeptide repeat protein [Aquirufa ecclesiirivi]MDF0693818.1 tetratricopeptide repeat protein [Aquirufa ecclesiirivi]NHC48496.1 tetratricopeptide repeat protein [Aquirufa ecclesiirivi]